MSTQPAVDKSVHTPGTGKGEEITSWEGKEAGRYREGEEGASRPVGKSTPRDATSVNPEGHQPVDPASPYLIPA